ncbi:MAG: hypothetical protein GF310_08330 [candidate division Zixibacteria bacterium]|nr:hypothetical protein [candidate division Zixibacteria bacterium]
MMSREALISILTVTFLLLISTPLSALVGDCNGNGSYDVGDVVALVSYIGSDGPTSPSMFNCDCDGFPGINYADYLQLIIGPPFPGLGTDYPKQSDVRFYFNVRIPPDESQYGLEVFVEVPDDFPVEAFMIPFSFEAEGGQALVEWLSADFTGTVANPEAMNVSPYSSGDILTIEANPIAHGGGAVLAAGASGLLCTLYFSSGSGEPNDLRIVSLAHSWPMLLKHVSYSGVDGERIFLPQFIRAPYGDGNSDGVVNLSDAVRIVNYIFLNGPAPGSSEP